MSSDQGGLAATLAGALDDHQSLKDLDQLMLAVATALANSDKATAAAVLNGF